MTRARRVVGFALLLLTAPAVARAQPIPIPDTWGGDILSRARLTGDWGGFRDAMGKKGVVFDADLLLTPQSVLGGGGDTGAQFWGNAEYTLNVDTGKAGLWPGGFLKVRANSGFGDSVLRDAGAFVPVNTAALLPRPSDPTTALMHATFMQFLSPKLGMVAGKFFTVDMAHGEFAGNYRTQFSNAALVVPSTAALVPISTFGGGIILLPWKGTALSALVVDPSGKTTDNDVSEAFRDGVMLLTGAQVGVKPFGLAGHQHLQFVWSDKERLSLEQDPSNLARFLVTEEFPRLGNPGPILRRIIERFLPELLVPVQPLKHERDTWAVFYGFDQYLWQPGGNPKRGIGVFFTFGATDGEANPIKYSYAVGIGGNGVVPARPNDTFGIAWARTELSEHFVPAVRQRLGLGLEREDAIEMYYNAAITPWLNATLDLQVIDSALDKTLDSSSRRLKDVDTTVVGGIRLYVRF
jgi:porin